MWEAKHINFDSCFGFDGQFLAGAGVQETIAYLEANGNQFWLRPTRGCKTGYSER